MRDERETAEDLIDREAVVAHQIKAPLATLQTIVRTLLGGFAGELGGNQKKMLESADRKCVEAMETVRGLLDLAEARRSGPPDAVADLARAALEARERFGDSAEEKDIELGFHVEPETAPVRAEQAALDEAVAALVENALTYTPEGGRIEVEVTADPETDAVHLRVSDSGIGIPEKERAQLFEPFFRASNAKEMVPKGTGLGLPFVRAIARSAGGSIAASSSELGGAEFVAEFPRLAGGVGDGAEPEEPSFRVVVVGGVAAGPKIASKIKRLDPRARVTIVERGRVLSYAGCGLPYYIAGQVEDQRQLVSTSEGVLRGPDYFERIKGVRVMNRTEAIRVDRQQKRVTVRDLISGEEQTLSYDKLALAVGAEPIIPSIPGTHLENIYTLHGLEHAEGIKADLAETRARDVTIVGGGLIGVETTEALVAAGCRVTLVEMLDQVLPILDWEMAELVRRHLESKGVRVLLNTRVTGFEGDGRVRRVRTGDGSFPAELVIMGVGVRPNVALAAETGLELGRTGAIKVDQQMRTSDPDIYAAGDCVEAVDRVTGEPCYVPLGSTANKQGRVAAINICGGREEFPGVMGTTVCKVFDYTVARAGLTAEDARQRDYEVVTTLTPGMDRAHFMPNAHTIVIKLIGDAETRKLLGIQVVGPGEAAKRADVAVTAMTAGLPLSEIANLDLCYAPSYSEALDNLHTAANVMRNKLDGHVVGIKPMEVRRKLEAGEEFTLLDVRSHEEFADSHVEGSRNIPLGALRGRVAELPRDRQIVCLSRVSLSAYEASIKLRAAGFEDVKIMDGGLSVWPYATVGQ